MKFLRASFEVASSLYRYVRGGFNERHYTPEDPVRVSLEFECTYEEARRLKQMIDGEFRTNIHDHRGRWVDDESSRELPTERPPKLLKR